MSERLVAPLCVLGSELSFEGGLLYKPWDKKVTAAILHLETPVELQLSVELLRLQEPKAHLIVVDLGSRPETINEIETLRDEDLEIHYLRGHAYRGPQEPIAAALDLVLSLCHTKYLFICRATCFVKKQDFFAGLISRCTDDWPVVGYRAAEELWPPPVFKRTAAEGEEWIVQLLDRPPLLRYNALFLNWAMLAKIPICWRLQGVEATLDKVLPLDDDKPVAELGFVHCLNEAGISPLFVGSESLGFRHTDEYIDSINTISPLTAEPPLDASSLAVIKSEMQAAATEARERILAWGGRLPLRLQTRLTTAIGSFSVPAICECPQPGFCDRFRLEMRGRMWEICQGIECSPKFRHRYLRRFGHSMPGFELVKTLDCCYLGDKLGAEPATHASLSTQTPTFQCRHPAHATTTAAKCQRCCDYAPQADWSESCGVAIGSHNMPTMVELQIRVIRYRCGPVPILIADDHSSGFADPAAVPNNNERLYDLASSYPDVFFWPTPRHIGHANGDALVFWRAIHWAKWRGLDYVAKVSQRFVLDYPYWLQDVVKELRLSEMPLAASKEKEWPIRTEAVVMRVQDWLESGIMDGLITGQLPSPAEPKIYELIEQYFTDRTLPWWSLGWGRQDWQPHTYWYENNTVEELQMLAQRHGMVIGDDYHQSLWSAFPGYLK